MADFVEVGEITCIQPLPVSHFRFERCQGLIPNYETVNPAGAIEYKKWFDSGLEKATNLKEKPSSKSSGPTEGRFRNFLWSIRQR